MYCGLLQEFETVYFKALLKLPVILFYNQFNSSCQSFELKPSSLPVGGAIGSCVKYTDKSKNLGVIQINPQAATDGSLSITYLNGDSCKDNQRYSTRIIFQCDQTTVIFFSACY